MSLGHAVQSSEVNIMTCVDMLDELTADSLTLATADPER